MRRRGQERQRQHAVPLLFASGPPIVAPLPGYRPLEAPSIRTGPLPLSPGAAQRSAAGEYQGQTSRSQKGNWLHWRCKITFKEKEKVTYFCDKSRTQKKRRTLLTRVCAAAADCGQIWNDWSAWFYHTGTKCAHDICIQAPSRRVLFLEVKLLLGGVSASAAIHWMNDSGLWRRNA